MINGLMDVLGLCGNSGPLQLCQFTNEIKMKKKKIAIIG